jgi:hypothetical protein
MLALLLRGLIPAGYMPDFSGHGVLKICDGVHHQAAGQESGKSGGKESPCPFSVGAVYDAPASHPPLQIAAAFTMIRRPSSASFIHAKIRAFCNASPRSPPAFS